MVLCGVFFPEGEKPGALAAFCVLFIQETFFHRLRLLHVKNKCVRFAQMFMEPHEGDGGDALALVLRYEPVRVRVTAQVFLSNSVTHKLKPHHDL